MTTPKKTKRIIASVKPNSLIPNKTTPKNTKGVVASVKIENLRLTSAVYRGFDSKVLAILQHWNVTGDNTKITMEITDPKIISKK